MDQHDRPQRQERHEKTKGLVQSLFRAQRFAALSTHGETGPYASLVAFWADDDLSRIVFATMRATRKFNFLARDPRVALLLDNRSNRDVDVREAMAVTATGWAREIAEKGARAAAADEYLAKHPHLESFIASPGCALVQIDVDVYYVVTHFQSVVELHMREEAGAKPAAESITDGCGADGSGGARADKEPAPPGY